MARKTRREKQMEEVSKEAEMDMTPMIDVVFLLIIFFLCIDFKVLEAKLPTYLPKDKGSQPEEVEEQEQLHIKIVCERPGKKRLRRPGTESKAYYLVGHVIRFEVGPKKVETLDELKDELQTIFDDPNRDVPDPKNPGKKKKISVVVEPGTNAVYGDVAPTVDAIVAVGFDDINFGGGLGSSTTGAYKDRPKPGKKKN